MERSLLVNTINKINEQQLWPKPSVNQKLIVETVPHSINSINDNSLIFEGNSRNKANCGPSFCLIKIEYIIHGNF